MSDKEKLEAAEAEMEAIRALRKPGDPFRTVSLADWAADQVLGREEEK